MGIRNVRTTSLFNYEYIANMKYINIKYIYIFLGCFITGVVCSVNMNSHNLNVISVFLSTVVGPL